MQTRLLIALLPFALTITLEACGNSSNGHQIAEGPCQISDPTNPPDDLETVTCKADFDALASQPIDATLPSATSMKVVLDTLDADHVWMTNTQKFSIHYKFCSAHLSGGMLPTVGDLASFNSTEYFSPDRRFLLGAVTYYASPDKWVLELSPYDTMSADMIKTLFYAVKEKSYYGPKLAFHPTSDALSKVAATLPADIPVVSTDDIYAGIDYQPLSLATGVGTLHYTTVANVNAGEYDSPYTILVLDSVPNDLSVVQGTITRDFQTPLSHINVLAHNRKAPNMGLRNALDNPDLRALEEQLVKLTTTAESWSIEPISAADAQAWWDAHAPAPVTLPPYDLTATDIAAVADVTPDPSGSETLRGNLQTAITRYGAKAAHYSTLVKTAGVPIKPAFAIPIYWYHKFMTDNGFDSRIAGFLADPTFVSDPGTRMTELEQLRIDIQAAPLPADMITAIRGWFVAPDFANVKKMRFRSSSNSEDLSGFPCAGCYTSYSGAVADDADWQLAIKQVYASAWDFRTFEIRTYYGVAQDSFGMALLCHGMFADEAANGVAVTANPFDASDLDPALYINVQLGGDVEVVAPPPGVASDQFLYYFSQPNQPISFIAHSSLTSPGVNVLNDAQTYELGKALTLIHDRFSDAYGPGYGNNGWYAMDVEFKFDNEDDPQNPPHLYVKQARPYGDPNGATE